MKLIKMILQSNDICVKHVKQTVSLRIIQPLQMLILHHVFKSQYVYFSNLPTLFKPSYVYHGYHGTMFFSTLVLLRFYDV